MSLNFVNHRVAMRQNRAARPSVPRNIAKSPMGLRCLKSRTAPQPKAVNAVMTPIPKGALERYAKLESGMNGTKIRSFRLLPEFVSVSHPEGMSANSPGLSEARATPRVHKRVCTPEVVPATLITPVVAPKERETLLRPAPGSAQMQT
jgi:hypothetical protein